MPPRSRTRSNKPRSKQTFAKKVATVYNRLERKGEPLHYVDEYGDGLPITSTANIVDLSDAINQGDGINDRSGNRICIKSIEFRARVARDATAVASTDIPRIIIFKWLPDDAVDAPTDMTDILEDDTNAFNVSPLHQTAVKRKKFKILLDTTFDLGVAAGTTATYGNAIRSTRWITRKWYPKGNQGIVDYNASDATTGKGKYFVVMKGQLAAGTENSTINYHFTQRFVS